MQSTKTEKGHSAILRACAFVLSVLFICSVFNVGHVYDVTASAASISKDTTISINFSEVWNNWGQANARIYVIWWDSNDSQKKYKQIDTSGFSSSQTATFTFPEACSSFIIIRMNPNDSKAYNDFDIHDGGSWPSGVWNQTTTAHSVVSSNLIVKNERDGEKYKLEWRMPIIAANQEFTAEPGYENASSNTGYGYQDGSELIKLFAADATFYDYFTDYELEHGWRSATDDLDISRSYKNRVPYTQFNKYISDTYVGSPNANWKYPLYFGNFYSHWGEGSGSYDSFPYGTVNGYYMCKENGSSYDTSSTHFQGASRPYSNGNLYNFSLYANDSNPVAKKNNNNYAGSVQGLVMSELKDDKLYMTTADGNGILSPYFSGKNDYINTVDTKFPLRIVETDNPTGSSKGKYTTYMFDSGAKSKGKSDVVYFSYNNGSPTHLNYEYTDSSNRQVIDAKGQGLLGLSGETPHRGFFPFDDASVNSGHIAHDYGFGMRLDIPFNVTEDGLILSQDSNGNLYNTGLPMRFDFEGDDDVWVFIDGQLALDLGGDHGNAKGHINFALNNGDSDAHSGVVETGAVNLKTNPTYGQSEYLNSNSATHDIKSILGTITDESGEHYDSTKLHTLTVFYMERGLVESNLRMSFSISPMGNRLTLDNTVDISAVNSEYRDRVQTQVDKDDFKFSFTDSLNSGSEPNYQYTKEDRTNTLGTGASVKDNEMISFKNQFKDRANISAIQTTTDSNNYTYSTTYGVVDNLIKQRKENHQGETGNEIVVASNTPTTNPADKVADKSTSQFAFDSQSSADRPYNDFSISVVNKVKVGNLDLSKKLTYNGQGNITDDNQEFTFDIYLQFPGETSYSSSPDKTVTLKGGESFNDLTGLPIGTKVKIEERALNIEYGYDFESAVGGTVMGRAVELTVDADSKSVTVTNNKITTGTTLTVFKTINGKSPAQVETDVSKEFRFKLYALNSNGTINTSKTPIEATNNTNDGAITFDGDILQNLDIRPAQYRYLLEEIEESNSRIEYDTKKYLVLISTIKEKSGSTYTGKCNVVFYNSKYDSAAGSYSASSAVSEVKFNNVIKRNTGFLKVIKENGTSGEINKILTAKFMIEPVVGNNSNAIDNARADKATISDVSLNLNGESDSYELPFGWYRITETNAPTGFELGNDNPKWVLVSESNSETSPASVTFINYEKTQLPRTGGVGVVVLIVSGIALIALGIYLLKPTKKERDSAAETKAE